jgi:hypothetical protein
MTTKPDTINAKGSDAKFTPHPDGQFVAKCVDTIDLGEKVNDYPGSDQLLIHKCALVFRTGEKNTETGEAIDIAQEFTVSMGEKANLRKFLEAWRGKKYTANEIEGEGVPLHKLTGNLGLITVEQRRSRNDRTYAVIAAIVGVPEQMKASVPKFEPYERAEYWDKRKKEYAEAAKKLKAEASQNSGQHAGDEFEDFPDAGADDDSDLPF